MKRNYIYINHPAYQLAIILTLSLTTFFLNLDGWDLWDPDEPRYAQVAKEMIDTGTWILPHHNSQVYPDKPPVFFWLIALSSLVKGEVTSFTARFPSALAAVLGVLLTYFLGSKLYGARAGFISALVLSTTVEYLWLGRRANIDMTLTCLILTALILFYQGYLTSHKRYYYLMYAFMGIATLTKGPVGFLLPTLTVALYLIATHKRQLLPQTFLNWGALIFITIVCAWLIPAGFLGGKEYLHEILFNQTLGRVHDSWSHKAPFYYYLIHIPPLMLPWFVFLPSALLYIFTHRKKLTLDWQFPATWFFTIFVFFTLCSGKRELYLLPLFPAFALTVGLLWHTFFTYPHDRKLNRLVYIPTYFLFLSIIAACGAIPFIPDLLSSEYSQAFHFYHLALILGVCAAVGLFLLLKEKWILSFTTLVVVMIGSYLYAISSALPHLNQYKSAKPLALKALHLLQENGQLGVYLLKTSAYNFYTGRNYITPLETTFDITNFFLYTPGRSMIIANKEDFQHFSSFIPLPLVVLEERRIGDRTIVLISEDQEKPGEREAPLLFYPPDRGVINVKLVNTFLTSYMNRCDKDNVSRVCTYAQAMAKDYARLVALEFSEELDLESLRHMQKRNPDRWNYFEHCVNYIFAWAAIAKRADDFLEGNLAQSLKVKLGEL